MTYVEPEISLVLLVAPCLVAGWLAFLLYNPQGSRPMAVFGGPALCMIVVAVWRQTDPVVQGLPGGHVVTGIWGGSRTASLVYIALIVASAYGATRPPDRLARAHRESNRT